MTRGPLLLNNKTYMEDSLMEADLKDELARVRAREQRYKSNAEAQIAELRAQLEALQGVESRAAATTAELEKLKSDFSKLDNQKIALLNEVTTVQARLNTMEDAELRAQASASELKKIRSAQEKLEKENVRLKQKNLEQKALKSRCGTLEKENVSLRNKVGSMEAELAALSAAAALTKASATELKKLKIAQTKLQEENASLTAHNRELEIKLVILDTYISQIGAKNLAKTFIRNSKSDWTAPFIQKLEDLGYTCKKATVTKKLKTIDYEHSILDVLDKLSSMFVPITQGTK